MKAPTLLKENADLRAELAQSTSGRAKQNRANAAFLKSVVFFLEVQHHAALEDWARLAITLHSPLTSKYEGLRVKAEPLPNTL